MRDETDKNDDPSEVDKVIDEAVWRELQNPSFAAAYFAQEVVELSSFDDRPARLAKRFLEKSMPMGKEEAK